MSWYILNAGEHPPTGKVQTLVERHGAVRMPEPGTFEDTPLGHLYVCVVENAAFEAVGVAIDPVMFRRMKYDVSGRPKTWLLMDKAVVRELAPVILRGFFV